MTTTEKPAALPQVKAARHVGVSPCTIWRWEKAGLIEGRRVGGLKFYDVEKLEALVGVGAKADEHPQ